MTQPPVIEAIDISSGYGKSLIVDRISLSVNDGEIVTIVGPNGSGKSTLLKGMIGITKKFGGKVLFQGNDVTNTPLHQLIRMGVGYVPQLDNIFTNLTVQENLEMGGYIQEDEEKLRSGMEDVFVMFPELRLFKGRKADTLSGGERQMLAIARGLMVKPSLLILDEPTSNLAPKAISTVHAKIKGIRDLGISVLMAEQNAKRALEISDRAYVLVSGRCVYHGGGADVLNLDLGKVFFGRG